MTSSSTVSDANTTSNSASGATPSYKKRRLSSSYSHTSSSRSSDANNKRSNNPILASAALINAASQATTNGFPATLASIQMGVVPLDTIEVSARKLVSEIPPMVHLSKTDTAPQLKIVDFLTVKGGMRGYRTSRATHGVQNGGYYYECWIQPGPTVEEILTLLPPNARLAPKLKEKLQRCSKTMKDSDDNTNDGQKKTNSSGKHNQGEEEQVGGHTRIGWSTRLGDLQAPVGYDKWSYGYRDIAGSRVHKSRREDDWGSNESYRAGDIVGFAISCEQRKIYFFKNGIAMGHFIVSRGKREGGAAFENIPEGGVYYPAISVFLGGVVRANFGPHFVYNPRKLPHGLKVKPVSELCEKPPLESEVMSLIKQYLPKKTDDTILKALETTMKIETKIRMEAYEQHYQRHIRDVKVEREARNLSTNDLSCSNTELGGK